MAIIEYPKINTLWKRDEDNNFNIIPGEYVDDYKDKDYESIEKWDVTEKLDGTNIRVVYKTRATRAIEVLYGDEEKTDKIFFLGRKEKSEIPLHLDTKLHDIFKLSMFTDFHRRLYPDNYINIPIELILFGEGVGKGIQKSGEKYINDEVDFFLFDVCMRVYNLYTDLTETYFYSRDKVHYLAYELGIKTVPYFGKKKLSEAVAMVSDGKGFTSKIPHEERELIAEGIVCRKPGETTDPIMWKLKVNDYARLKQGETNA